MNTAPTTTTAAAPVHLDLDARLAMVGALMDERLALANIAFEVDTVHFSAADPIPAITAPPSVTPTVAPCPYPTPVAATLHHARIRLESAGWCTGQLRDQDRACLVGAIRAAAPSRAAADDACAVLLEAVRRDFPRVDTIPSWNDTQPDPRQPLLYLDRAAALAHSRNI